MRSPGNRRRRGLAVPQCLHGTIGDQESVQTSSIERDLIYESTAALWFRLAAQLALFTPHLFWVYLHMK